MFSIIGLIVGGWIAYGFILPDGLLDISLGQITLGHILRIIGSFLVTGLGGGIGHFIDIGRGKAD